MIMHTKNINVDQQLQYTMPKEQTEKSRYPSMYSPGGFVTEVQYIIELVCERNAAFTKRDLPPKFWNLPEWQTFFKSQLRKCHSLLKKYPAPAIIAALKNPKAKTIYSLFAPWLEDIIRAEARILAIKKLEPRKPNVLKPINTVKVRERRLKKNTLSKLKALEDGEKSI